MSIVSEKGRMFHNTMDGNHWPGQVEVPCQKSMGSPFATIPNPLNVSWPAHIPCVCFLPDLWSPYDLLLALVFGKSAYAF